MLAHYVLELRLSSGEWIDLAIWAMCPEHLSKFLRYYLVLHHSLHCEESRNMARVRRIPYAYAQAQWEFDGTKHYVPIY